MICALLLASSLSAQSVCLPAPRLLTTMPMGGQVGTQVDVTISGENIETVSGLVFSNPALTATAKLDANGQLEPNRFVVSIAADCPTGIHETRVLTPMGLSSSRIFNVNNLVEFVQTEPTTTPETALTIPLGSVCNAIAQARGVNHYRFTAKQGQRLIVDCAARGIESKLNAVVMIADMQGRELLVQRRGDLLDFTVPADGDYFVKVHDLTFKGGPHYFYRLAVTELAAEATPQRQASTLAVNACSWPPAGLPESTATTELETADSAPQLITLPCDLVGKFFPAADVDVFEFDATQGEVWWIEVASERLGLPTDPAIVVQRVESDKDNPTLVDIIELSDIASPVKVSSNAYAYDGPPYNAGSSDILGKLEIPQTGRYRLQVLDLFGGTRSDARNQYRLVIRQAAPDFALVAWALHRELRNGDRNALSKPIALRPGATMALEVAVIRRDGFDGEIELAMENLPDGVSAAGINIAAGKTLGLMLITADQGAPQGFGSARMVGTAKINEQTVSHDVRLASMSWPVRDGWSEIPSPRLLLDVPVSVSGVEVAPITIAPREDKVYEAIAGQKLSLPLLHLRRSEFSGSAISLKTFGNGFEQNPKFDLPLASDSSEAVLDLAQLKTPPGDYKIAFYGTAVAKYVPPAKPTADGSAAAVVPPTDTVDMIISEPISIRVHPEPQPVAQPEATP